jgi:hypothetical protein
MGLAAIVAAAALFVAARLLWQAFQHDTPPGDLVENASPPGLGDGRQR